MFFGKKVTRRHTVINMNKDTGETTVEEYIDNNGKVTKVSKKYIDKNGVRKLIDSSTEYDCEFPVIPEFDEEPDFELECDSLNDFIDAINDVF